LFQGEDSRGGSTVFIEDITETDRVFSVRLA
jgi:hypothetical protein